MIDGYIVDILGPYLAKPNDTTIMKQTVRDLESVCRLMVPGDIFIVDRDFCDLKSDLENKDLQVQTVNENY